jgi:hypothetical protein
LAKAVFNLPPMAQVFKEVAPQAAPAADEFSKGQWWVNELDALASHPTGQKIFVTPDLKRAVAVVHKMLRAIAAPQAAPASPWQAALEIRMAQGWKLKGDRIPVLYTDTINGDSVGRDDLWLCTTEALVAAPQAAPAQEHAKRGVCAKTCDAARTSAGCKCYPAPQAAPEIADYEAAIADHNRLVRELDVLLNGDGAAPQASLCDLVSQIKAQKAAPQAASAPDLTTIFSTLCYVLGISEGMWTPQDYYRALLDKIASWPLVGDDAIKSAASAKARELLAAAPQSAAPQAAPAVVADMFWDGEDGEIFGYEIDEIIGNYGPGDRVKIDCAKRLPSIEVLVVADGDDFSYQIIDGPKVTS